MTTRLQPIYPQTYSGAQSRSRTGQTPQNAHPRIQAVPERYDTIAPWIIAKRVADLIDFMTEAFDACEVENSRIYNDDGTLSYVEVQLGHSIVMVLDAKSNWPATPSFLCLYVEDVDGVYQRALQAGAVSVTDLREPAVGDHVGRVRDAWGNLWRIQAHVKDVRTEALPEPNEPNEGDLAAMQWVREALQESLAPAWPGRAWPGQ